MQFPKLKVRNLKFGLSLFRLNENRILQTEKLEDVELHQIDCIRLRRENLTSETAQEQSEVASEVLIKAVEK